MGSPPQLQHAQSRLAGWNPETTLERIFARSAMMPSAWEAEHVTEGQFTLT